MFGSDSRLLILSQKSTLSPIGSWISTYREILYAAPTHPTTKNYKQFCLLHKYSLICTCNSNHSLNVIISLTLIQYISYIFTQPQLPPYCSFAMPMFQLQWLISPPPPSPFSTPPPPPEGLSQQILPVGEGGVLCNGCQGVIFVHG